MAATSCKNTQFFHKSLWLLTCRPAKAKICHGVLTHLYKIFVSVRGFSLLDEALSSQVNTNYFCYFTDMNIDI